MRRFPSPVLDYICDLTLKARAPAYLLIGQDGRLLDWGGRLERYGISGLRRGRDAGAQIAFLEGMPPPGAVALHLPFVQSASGRFADLHMFQKEGEIWALLLDTTPDEARQREIQQEANELSLIRDRLSGMLERCLEVSPSCELSRAASVLREEGDRKAVGVLSAGIRRLGPYSETEDPRRVLDFCRICLGALARPLRAAAGLISVGLGSGLTAVFGILPAGASPAAQTVGAALDAMSSVREANLAWRLAGEPVFGVGIGIASGPVVLGIARDGDRRAFRAVGPSVDLAARLAGRADSAEILIDGRTFGAIGELQARFSARRSASSDAEGCVDIFSCRERDEST